MESWCMTLFFVGCNPGLSNLNHHIWAMSQNLSCLKVLGWLLKLINFYPIGWSQTIPQKQHLVCYWLEAAYTPQRQEAIIILPAVSLGMAPLLWPLLSGAGLFRAVLTAAFPNNKFLWYKTELCKFYYCMSLEHTKTVFVMNQLRKSFTLSF